MEIISWEFGGACIPVVVHEGVIYAEHNQVAGGLKLDPSNLIHMATRNPKRFSVLNGSPEPVKKFFSANREVFGRKRIRRIWTEDDIINFGALGHSDVCDEFQRSFVRFIKQVARKGCVTRDELNQIVQKNNEQLLTLIVTLQSQVAYQGDIIENQRQLMAQDHMRDREVAEVVQEDISDTARKLQRGRKTKSFRKEMGLIN